ACSLRSTSACMNCLGPCAGCSTPLASSPNSASSTNSAIVRAATGGCAFVAMSVDHRDAALHLQHRVAVDLGHHAFHFRLDLSLDLDHHALDRDARLIDLDAVLSDLELDRLHRLERD